MIDMIDTIDRCHVDVGIGIDKETQTPIDTDVQSCLF